MSRERLVAEAERLGVDRPARLTRVELIDELVRRTVHGEGEQRRARGLLGRARDLVARVVERGLHLPDAAARIRGRSLTPASWSSARTPIATVTLAEIYAAQGHADRAVAVLDEVLDTEPAHAAARALRDRYAVAPPRPPVLPPEPDEAPPGDAPDDEVGPVSPPVTSLSLPVPVSVPPAPVPMLDDAPLPERYGVDELIVMAVDPRTVYLYWEVSDATLAEARDLGEGQLVLRIVAVVASWDGPRVETRDVAVGERTVGDWFVRDLPPGAVVRAAVGWVVGAAFEPLAVAPDAHAPQGAPSVAPAIELARVTPAGVVALAHDAARDPAIEPLVRAVRGAAAAGRVAPRGSAPGRAGGAVGAGDAATVMPGVSSFSR